MCCAGCSRASCRRFEIPEGEEAYGMEGEAMAVKHEEYDGDDEKRSWPRQPTLPHAHPRGTADVRHSTYKL